MRQPIIILIGFLCSIACTDCSTYQKENNKPFIEFLLEAPKEIRYEAYENKQNIPSGYKWVTYKDHSHGKVLVETQTILNVDDISNCVVYQEPDQSIYGVHIFLKDKNVSEPFVKNYEKTAYIVIDNAAYLGPLIRLEKLMTEIVLCGAIDKEEAEFIVRTINLIKEKRK